MRDGGAGGERLKAAVIAAAAEHVVAARHPDMAEVSGRAVGTALELAAADDAGADSRGDLDEEEIVVFRPVGGPLPKGHDVDVVVHQHRDRQRALDVPDDVESVPAGHDRRLHRHPGGMFHRAGQADADAGEVFLAAAGLVQQVGALRQHAVQHGLRAVGDVLGQPALRQHGSAQVRDGDDHVGGAHVDRQHDAGGGVEGKARRRPAAAGAGLAGRSNQSGVHQRVDAGRDGGAGQSGGESQLGAGAGLAVAQELEQVPGTGQAAGGLGGGGFRAGGRAHESVIARGTSACHFPAVRSMGFNFCLTLGRSRPSLGCRP